MDSNHGSTRQLDRPCRLCGAPVYMTCLEYEAIRQLNRVFDKIEAAFTSPEELAAELSSADRMDRIGVPEVTAS